MKKEKEYTSGMKWLKTDRPEGTRLFNKKLAEALLKKKIEFTKEEWEKFGIKSP